MLDSRRFGSIGTYELSLWCCMTVTQRSPRPGFGQQRSSPWLPMVVAHAEIARRFEVSRQTVINRRSRYLGQRTDGLHDEHQSERPRTLDRDNLIITTFATIA